MVGWALVPRTCPPPPFPPRIAVPRQERAWRLGGKVGEGAGKIGHRRASFYPPSPGAAPKKNGARGRGVEGGVISSQYQTRPYPYPFPSLALTRAPKGQCLGWERGRVGAGGTHPHHDPTTRTSRTGALCQIFFLS